MELKNKIRRLSSDQGTIQNKKQIEDTVHLNQFHFKLYFLTVFVLQAEPFFFWLFLGTLRRFAKKYVNSAGFLNFG